MEKQWAFFEIWNELFPITYTNLMLKRLRTNNVCQLHGGNFESYNFSACVLSGWLETHNISMKTSYKYTIHMRDSSVGNVTRLWAECPRNCGPIFGKSERSAVLRNVHTGSEDTLLFNVYLTLCYSMFIWHSFVQCLSDTLLFNVYLTPCYSMFIRHSAVQCLSDTLLFNVYPTLCCSMFIWHSAFQCLSDTAVQC